MDRKTVTLTIAGMALVTYLPRLLPLLFLTRNGADRRAFSPLVETWLRYVPVAVLAALLLPSLMVADGRANLAWDNLFFWAALPTLAVAWKTRSLFGAVLTGMAIVAVGRLWIG